MVVSQDISRPTSFLFVFISLIIALLFNAIPWFGQDGGASPDFVALL